MLLLVEKLKKEQDTETKLAGMGHGAFAHAGPAETRISTKNRPCWGRILGTRLPVLPLTKSPS